LQLEKFIHLIRKSTFKFITALFLTVVLTLPQFLQGQASVTYSPQPFYEANQVLLTLAPGGNLTIQGGTYGEVSLFANGASFDNPRGMVKDAVGNFYIAEIDGKRITKVTPGGVVSIVKQFGSFIPRDLAIKTANGDLFCVIANNRILWIKNSNSPNYPTAAPVYDWVNDATHVIAGDNSAGFMDGSGAEARFANPWGIAMGHDNTYLLVADYDNSIIRKVYFNYDQNGNISSSNTRVFSHYGGDFYYNSIGCTDVHVVNEYEWITTNWNNDRVSRQKGSVGSYTPFNGGSSATLLSHPNWSISNMASIYAYTVTGSTTAGPVYGNQNEWYSHNSNIAAAAVHAGILKAGETGTVYVYARTPQTSAGQIFPPSSSGGTTSNGVTSMGRPYHTVYPQNTAFVYQVFKFSTQPLVSSEQLVAGGAFNYANFDGTATTAYVDNPHQVALDGLGNIYVVESFNHKVRKISNAQTFAGTAIYAYQSYNTNAKVSTIAGSLWDNAYSGNVPTSSTSNGTNARFNEPRGLYFDADGGFLLVADSENDRIKKIQIEGFEVIPAPSAGLSFNSVNGQLTGTPTETTLASQYINTFNATSLGASTGGAATLSGHAELIGEYIQLVPRKNNQLGGLTIPATGVNHNLLQVSFRVLSTKNSSYGGNTSSQPADGFSYSLSSDASATATTPAAEVGTGSHLSISFASYGANRGIRIYYNPSNITSFSSTISSVLLAFSNNVSWMGNQSEVVIRVNDAGQLTLTLNGTAIFTNVQLPAGYLNANKADWKHVFKARTGGFDDLYGIDNVAILQGPGTTHHLIVARENNYYEELVVPVNVTIQAPTATATQTLCAGSTVANLTETTNISGATIAWYAAATGGSALSSSTVLASGTYYAAQISGAQESGREPVNVTIQSLGSVNGSSSVCSGSTANLTALNTTGNIQWQVSVNGGTSYSDIAGETSSSYTTSALSSAPSYRVNYTSGVVAVKIQLHWPLESIKVQ
jgi:sugar lactone lactonase YvrE